jgi:hypothetical protein
MKLTANRIQRLGEHMSVETAESINAKIKTESTSAMIQTANTTVIDHHFQVNTQYEMIDQYVSRRFGFSGQLVVFFKENPGVAMSICLKQEEIMLGMRSSLKCSDDMNKMLKDQIDHMTALHAEERQLHNNLRLEIQEKLMDQYAKAYLV